VEPAERTEERMLVRIDHHGFDVGPLAEAGGVLHLGRISGMGEPTEGEDGEEQEQSSSHAGLLAVRAASHSTTRPRGAPPPRTPGSPASPNVFADVTPS